MVGKAQTCHAAIHFSVSYCKPTDNTANLLFDCTNGGVQKKIRASESPCSLRQTQIPFLSNKASSAMKLYASWSSFRAHLLQEHRNTLQAGISECFWDCSCAVELPSRHSWLIILQQVPARVQHLNSSS